MYKRQLHALQRAHQSNTPRGPFPAPPVPNTAAAEDPTRITPDGDDRDNNHAAQNKGKSRITPEQQEELQRQDVLDELVAATAEYQNATPADVAEASDRLDTARARTHEMGINPDAPLTDLDDTHTPPTPPTAGPSNWHTTSTNPDTTDRDADTHSVQLVGDTRAGPSRSGAWGLSVTTLAGARDALHADRAEDSDGTQEYFDAAAENADSQTKPSTLPHVASGLPSESDGKDNPGNGFESRDTPRASGPARRSLPLSAQTRADVEGWIGDVNKDGDASVAPVGDRLTNCGPTTWAVFDRLSGTPSFGRAHPMQLQAHDVGDATGLPLQQSDPAAIAEQLHAAGVGAHTVVVVQFDKGVAHSFNALFDGDAVWAIDGQHGTITAWPPDLGRPENPVTGWFAGTAAAHSTDDDKLPAGQRNSLGDTTVTGMSGDQQQLPRSSDHGAAIAENPDAPAATAVIAAAAASNSGSDGEQGFFEADDGSEDEFFDADDGAGGSADLGGPAGSGAAAVQALSLIHI